MNYNRSIERTLARCAKRRAKGATEYGDLDFLTKDNLQELKEELYDVINYALFTIVKVETIQEKLLKIEAKNTLN